VTLTFALVDPKSMQVTFLPIVISMWKISQDNEWKIFVILLHTYLVTLTFDLDNQKSIMFLSSPWPISIENLNSPIGYSRKIINAQTAMFHYKIDQDWASRKTYKHYAGPPISKYSYPVHQWKDKLNLNKHKHMSLNTKDYFVKQISYLSKGEVMVAQA